MKLKSFAHVSSNTTLFLVFLCVIIAVARSQVLSQSQDIKEIDSIPVVANGAVNLSSQVGTVPVIKWVADGKSKDNRTGVEFPDPKSGRYAFISQQGGRYGVVVYDVKIKDNTRSIVGLYFSLNILRKSKPLQIRDALLSPDKEKVLFKFGFSSEEDLYSLYILNLSNGAVTKLPYENLASPDVSWSVEGNNVAYISGGNKSNGLYSNYPPQDYAGPRQLIIYSLERKKSSLISSNDTISGLNWMNDHVISYSVLSGPDPYYPALRQKYTDNVKKGVINKPEIHFFDVTMNSGKEVVRNSVSPFPSPSGKYVLSFSRSEIQSNEPLESDWLDSIKNYEVSLTSVADGTIISRGNLRRGNQSMLFWGADERSAFLASFSALSSTSKLLAHLTQ